MLKYLVVGAVQVNCFILADDQTGHAAVIDAGDDAPSIQRIVKAQGLQVTHLINTHAHLDHVMALDMLGQETGAPFYLHEADLPILHSVPQQAMMWLGVDVPPPPEPDQFLSAGDHIQIGAITLRVLHVPGHSPGSVAFVDDDARRVFAGDTLFAGSIGRTDLPGGSLETLLQAIREQLFTLDDDYELLPGHGPFSTIGRERQTNPFFID